MTDTKDQSMSVKAGGTTYFFDIKEAKTGSLYLLITESRFKGEGEERNRSSMAVFPDNAVEFTKTVATMTAKLNKKK